MKIDFKNIKLIKNKDHVKDPPRYPKVINEYENSSIRAFRDSLSFEIQQIVKEISNFV